MTQSLKRNIALRRNGCLRRRVKRAHRVESCGYTKLLRRRKLNNAPNAIVQYKWIGPTRAQGQTQHEDRIYELFNRNETRVKAARVASQIARKSTTQGKL
nr:hypothetical protein L204_00294 [Cryptococcus depauperatus CBS 7855]